MSYAARYRDRLRRVAHFVDKILKGAKPADLPVEQPMQFELVINLKTVQDLGLTLSPTFLFRADEVLQYAQAGGRARGEGTMRSEANQGARRERVHSQPKSHPEPNNRLQPTASSVRSCLASATRRA